MQNCSKMLVALESNNTVICGNCGFECGIVITKQSLQMVKLNNFRISLDSPVEIARVCARGRVNATLHHHRYKIRILSTEVKDLQTAQLTESFLQPKMISHTIGRPPHQYP